MDWELIFWIVLGIIALAVIIRAMCEPDDSIDITWGHRRDWERWEKEWNK